MADYFANFSFILPLADDVEKQYVLKLSQSAISHRLAEEQPPGDFPESLVDVLEDWQFEMEDCEEGIWLHSECGGIDAVCALVQHLLQKFNPSKCVTFEWSHDCTKPRIDANGGGAAIITAKEIKTMNTADWLTANT